MNALRTLGYEAVWQGERSWNGVAILARHQVPVLTRTSLPGNPDGIFARGWRHPFDRLRASSERSRSSGGAKDLPFRHFVPREIPRPAGKKRGLFGMTPGNSDSPNHEDHQAHYIEAAVQGVLITSIYLPNGDPQPGPTRTAVARPRLYSVPDGELARRPGIWQRRSRSVAAHRPRSRHCRRRGLALCRCQRRNLTLAISKTSRSTCWIRAILRWKLTGKKLQVVSNLSSSSGNPKRHKIAWYGSGRRWSGP